MYRNRQYKQNRVINPSHARAGFMFKKGGNFKSICSTGGGSEEESVWSEGQQQLQLKDRLQEHHISHSVSSYAI